MIKFFKHLTDQVIQSNQDIQEKFLNLDASQKKLLIKQLSSRGRSALLSIIENNGYIQINKSVSQTLKTQLKQVKNFTAEITRRNDTSSPFSQIKKIFIKSFANLAAIFNLLTADKTNSLIKLALLKQEPKINDLPCASNKQLNKLLSIARAQAETGAQVDLAKLLKENDFSTEIRGQTFSNTFSLKEMNLEGITFTNCKFNWALCSHSTLKDVTFKNCDIFNLSLMSSSLEDCFFENCEMREVMFTGAELKNVYFVRSSVISSSFEDACLSECIFKSCSLPATHFLEATIENSAIFSSQLKDAVFFGTLNQFEVDDKTKETAVVTRPTTAILVHPEARGITTPKAYMKLDQSANTIPLRITMQSQKTTKEGVNAEVEAALQSIGPYDRTESPIAQRLLKYIAENPEYIAENPESESAKILKKAEKLASEVDSFFLPGGEDVPPALYGQEKGEQTDWGGDYRRSILELGMIHHSFNKGIPLMAVCRGFQMSNVYFGAQLIQHIDGHKKLQTFELGTPEKSGLYAEAMKHNIISACFHHQAVSQDTAATEHLEPSIFYEGLVKASELKESGTAPMVLLQFHPEFYKAHTADSLSRDFIDTGLNIRMAEDNERFWDILSDSAEAHRTKQVTLQQLEKTSSTEKAMHIQATIEDLDGKRAKIFDIYKKNYYNWKNGLFDIVKNNPKLLIRYLGSNENGDPNHFFEEREALISALKYDARFLQALIGDDNRNLDQIVDTLREADPALYQEIEKEALQPFLNPNEEKYT